MLKVLITGVNGFIGSHIAERMIKNGMEVYGLVRKTSDLRLIEGMPISLRYGDITDAASVQKSVADMDIVIHNAGLASDWGPLDLFMKINFQGTQNIVKASMEAEVKRFVLMSSVAIHGFGSEGTMNELSPIKTHGFHYNISKWEAEKWTFEYTKNSPMEVSAIRPGNVFGPKDHTFIEKYLDVLVKGQGGYVNGGHAYTCPVYVGNLSQAVYLAATHPKAAGEASIITDGYDITWRQFTEQLCEKMSIKPPQLSIPFAIGNPLALFLEKVYIWTHQKSAPLLTSYRMHNGGKNYHFSIEKAKNILGYTLETPLDEALEKTVVWYRGR
jgi:nucleoside-diphosphate-sugar epimerase